MTIDLVEQAFEGVVLDGRKGNEVEFMRLFVEEEELAGIVGNWIHEQVGR